MTDTDICEITKKSCPMRPKIRNFCELKGDYGQTRCPTRTLKLVDGVPVVPARRIDGCLVLAVACPFCGQTGHTHGPGREPGPRYARGSHCDDPRVQRGYILEEVTTVAEKK